MLWIYNIGIFIYGLILKVAAIFNPKAKLFIEGRKNIFELLKQRFTTGEQTIWFHFASLGEFEQGRPVLEKLKTVAPLQRVVVTFFSPSGYEIRKNYALADVFYLPLDTPGNAKKFIEIVNPKMAIFTKYEFWFHYFHTLNAQKIPLYLISGIFRPSQLFFKPYGCLYRSMLKMVTHFFAQNQESVTLLAQVGIEAVTLAGDTRFDRVYENAQHPKQLKEIELFCGEANVLIAGSTWPPDEQLLTNFSQDYPDWKLIVAPHEIGTAHLSQLAQLFPTAIKYSTFSKNVSVADEKILIIDNIGMLSSLYQYAKVAYIGGGFGVGIHNTLEAAAFGLPVIFGPNYAKFQEAKELIALQAAQSITDSTTFTAAFEFFKFNDKAAKAAAAYVTEKKGATELIIKMLTKG
jgi:3-deoxy-D-manno-octulosonic-acid transferase